MLMPKLLNKQYLFATLFAFVSEAYSAAPSNITPAEMALLPTYCPYTQSFQHGIKLGMTNHPMAERWKNTIGPSFWALHHYCWALIELQRASRRSTPEQEKYSLRKSALGNFLFVIEKSDNDFVLLPEIYTWIGKTELLLENPSKAESAFGMARSLKQDYWPAYFHWGEYLLSVGNRKEAREIVQAGLQHSPNANPLIELLKRLD